MGAGIDMAIERPSRHSNSRKQLLVNLELNNRCAFTRTCGATCFLNVHSTGIQNVVLPDSEFLAAATELLNTGGIRHLALAGKEVMESPHLVFEILKAYHATPQDARPDTIGLISANHSQLFKAIPQFCQHPLCWIVISLDTATSGLRKIEHSPALLNTALQIRKSGGTGAIGVNTTFSDHNLLEVLDIGQSVEEAAVDQWSLCQIMHPKDGKMVPKPLAITTHRVVDAVLQNFHNSKMEITVEVSLQSLIEFVGVPARQLRLDAWRVEYAIAPRIKLIARTPFEGFFLRLRYDGEILSREDFLTVGKRKGSYGKFEKGAFDRLIPHLTELQNKYFSAPDENPPKIHEVEHELCGTPF